MTELKKLRYFVPTDSETFAAGWYLTTNNDGVTRAEPEINPDNAEPNRIIIDDNTPDTELTGGGDADEFLITSDANTVTINDDSGANVIVFERDVVITSIERQTGSEGASVVQYVMTLSSGKTITLRNPASFTFQHFGDVTRTAPISAEDFFTAYEDGFAASDASHPDITGDASGPSGVQGPMITGTETGSVTEDDQSSSSVRGTLTASEGLTIALQADESNNIFLRPDGSVTTPYGSMRFDASSSEWVYVLGNANEATQNLAAGQTVNEVFTFAAGTATFDVTITITGVNDAPTVSGEFFTRVGAAGGQFILTNLSDRFTDVDEGDELTFEVTLDDGAALSTIGLTYDSDEDEITGTLTETGSYVIKIVATDKSGATVEATFELNIFSAIPIIQRNSLTYNPDATSITIDETMLEVTSGNESDPTLLVYTITTLPDAGMLLKSGTPLNNGDTFTQADINNGLITYVPNVSSPHTSQSNPLSFTISDGVATLEEQTLEITSREVVGNTAYEGDPSTSGDLDVNDDTLLDSTTPFTISTQGTYGTASIGDDGEWVYTLDNGNADVRALNSGDTLTDTFVVDVNLASGRAETQTVTITISGRTNVFGTNGEDGSLGDASTSDNQAIFGFNSRDTLTGGSGDDLLVGGYGFDTIDLSAGGTDTVVYRINSSDTHRRLKAEDGEDRVFGFTPGEDKLVILDVNGSPTTLAGLFDSLTKDAFQLRIDGDDDRSGDLSSSELDAGARAFIQIDFQVGGTVDGGLTSAGAGGWLRIYFDRVTSEALNDRAVFDTLTGGTNSFEDAIIPTVAQLSSLFGGFGRPGYDAALDDGGFISVIGPDDLPDSYFEIVPISGDETGSVTEGGAPGDDNTGTLTAPGNTITLVSKETTDSPGMSTGTYGVMAFDGTIWTYTLDDRAEALGDQQTATETFTFNAGGATFEVTITITGANDAPVVSAEFFNSKRPTGEQFTLSNLSDRFTDVDEGDELTFTVTLDDGAALSTIGLTYDSDEDEITGLVTKTGTYVIKIVATDKSGATVEATFDLNINIFSAIPIIQRNSLTYNPDATNITIDETILKITSENQSDPTLLVYTITTLPDAGRLLKSGTQLNNGDTFTQADINNGLITYVPDVGNPSTSQSNPLSFTISDGEADIEETLQITSREDVDVQNPEEDNTIDRSGETAPQKIEAGDGSDIITGGDGNDQIDGGAGDDEIKLTRTTVNNVEEDAGADEVLYTFGYDGVGIDGGDEIVGFKHGQDKVTFVVQDSRQFANLEEFLGSLKGVDDEDLTADDAFIATMMWGLDENGVFYFDGVLLHFKEGTFFGGGRISSPVVSITFDERLDFDDLVEILGGAENVANNFDGGLTAFKNLDEVLPRLFGESSIDFVVIPFSNSISVIDGPVTGAEVFFDIDDDGEVSDVEKDAQRDASGRSLYITGDDGSVSFPEQYVGRAFVAVVGSAYDIDSGERLEGAFRSLDEGRGGIATPITDLIVTYLEEVEGQVGTPTTEQEVLDEIFGDDEVTLADVLAAANYEIPADTDTPENNKKDLISRAAIALTEIKENDDLTDGDGDGSTTKVEIVSALKTLVDLPDDSSVADLKATVDARVAEVNAVKGGKPIATPTPTSVDGVEDTDYAFPDTPEALTGFFGFRDPSGNNPAADTSSFRGVYIRIAIENASLWLDDNIQVVADTDLSGRDSAPTIDGYVYVTFDNLDNLKITPAPNFNGDLALVYRVWDGEAVSSDAELIINIAGVNDAPVASEVPLLDQTKRLRTTFTTIEPDILKSLFTDADGDDLDITVLFFEDDGTTEADIGLAYSEATGITGTLNNDLSAGNYKITITADDGTEMAERTFTITVVVDYTPITKPVPQTIDEDTDYAFPDTAQELAILFGFSDHDGNRTGQPPSAFKGVYIKLSSIADDKLLLGDDPAFDAGATETAAPEKPGYIYVTLANLGGLKWRPPADFNGILELVYQVWDGEDASGDTKLIITVTTVPTVLASDGPVSGGEVFFDINGDGNIDKDEIRSQKSSVTNRPRYITDGDGIVVSFPEEYLGRAFRVEVEGAVNLATGEILEGRYRSLDNGKGGIASPITHAIVTVLNSGGRPAEIKTEQDVLDLIFGADPVTDSVTDSVTVADILNVENYETPDVGDPNFEIKELISKAVVSLIEIRTMIALIEARDHPLYKANPITIARFVRDYLDDPNPTTSPSDDKEVSARNEAIKALDVAVKEYLNLAQLVKNGQPIAVSSEFTVDRNIDVAFPDTLDELAKFFGFIDRGGNGNNQPVSALHGVYFKYDEIVNGQIVFGDGTPLTDDIPGLGGSDSAPTIDGYIYVTLEKLDGLVLRPDKHFTGTMRLVYRVFDGEETSTDGELTINVLDFAFASDQALYFGSRIENINVSVVFEEFSFLGEPGATRVFELDTPLPAGISFDAEEGKFTGRPTEIGIHTIIVNGVYSDGRFIQYSFDIIVLDRNAPSQPPTLTYQQLNGEDVDTLTVIEDGQSTQNRIVYVDDPDLNPGSADDVISTRNSVVIRAGVRGGNKDSENTPITEVESARDEFKISDRVSAMVLITSLDVSIDGQYGTFFIGREPGSDKHLGDPVELIYYYAPFSRNDLNYENINALTEGEKAYDVLTFWATDGSRNEDSITVVVEVIGVDEIGGESLAPPDFDII